MSKAEVKKYIKSLDKSSLEELVLDLYSARKEAKDYLEYVIKPNDKGKLEEYREIITKEFYPSRGEAKLRFSVCRKAVSEFKSLDPAPEFLADLMLYIPECASEIANDWGDMWEQFYDATENNFKAAMKYISEHNLQSQFQKRIVNPLAGDFLIQCGISTMIIVKVSKKRRKARFAKGQA